jgi:hypothetical protein
VARVRAELEANEGLGLVSNLVRLSYFSHELSPEDLAAFPVLARMLAERGVYLVITPHNYQINQQGEYTPSPIRGQLIPVNSFLPDATDTRILGALAQRLKGCDNVIFGLWNEPANTTWATLEQVLRTQSEAVLAHFPQGGRRPLLLVPGIEWSRDFRGARIPLPADTYLIDVHDYPDFWNQDSRFKYQSMIGRVPVLISEMGGVLSRNYQPQSETDLARIRSILFGLVNAPERSGSLHYCIWKGDDSPDGVRTPEGALTPRGLLAQEERRTFPTQTRFTN